jgi:transposase-like protein
VGVTITGKKLILGFVQTATENQRACTEFLQSLVARGLRAEDGLLVVTDGAKGLHAAVAAVWGDRAVLQRCQWHKRENVVSYLTERHRTAMRRKLQAAYEQPTYEAAKRALGKIRQELRLLNASAVASLDEGLEQTLTLHRLGVFRKLGLGLKTTNMLESIHARVESRLGKVDYWKNSDQKQRWLATALLDLEPQLRRLKNYDALPQLRLALKAHVNSLQRSA